MRYEFEKQQDRISEIFECREHKMPVLAQTRAFYSTAMTTCNSPQIRDSHFKSKCTFQILGGGVAGSEDFASATLPTTPLDFQGNIKNVCDPTLLKIRFKIIVIPPPPPKKGQNQHYGASINVNGLLTLSGLLSLHFLLHMTSFIKPLIITCKLYME